MESTSQLIWSSKSLDFLWLFLLSDEYKFETLTKISVFEQFGRTEKQE